MNGCSKSIGSPEPRCIGARSVMLPDTKGDTAGTARRSATVCPRDRQHNQRQRHPIKAVRDLGADEFALHGRYVEVDIDGLTVASVYIQTGEAGTDRQLEKERFMAALAHRMATLTDRDAVVCGDWNIAHTENDIKNWRGNVKKSGFLPAERQWLTDLLAAGWVDVVRVLHPDGPGPYSWWSWRGRAFDNDAGWRIDYQLATRGLAARVSAARVERAAAYALRWSDHSPVTVEYATGVTP